MIIVPSNVTAISADPTATILTTISSGLNYPTFITAGQTNLYVSNQGSGTVGVINPETNTVTTSITMSAISNLTAIAASGSKVYVAGYSGGVSVIDQSTNTVTTTITGFTNPYGVAASSTKTYVANNGGTTVSVITQSSNTITKTITGFSSPYGIALTSTKAYVCDQGSNTIKVVDLSTEAIIKTISGFSAPQYAAATATKVYVCNSNNSIGVIDVATDTLTTTLTSGIYNTRGIAAGINTVYASAMNSGGSVDNILVIDVATNAITKTTAMTGTYLPSPLTVGFGKIYACNSPNNTVTVLT